MAESGLSKNQIIQELTRSTHGKLDAYTGLGKQAAMQDAEFLAHLIAWNAQNGQIRDSKVALPIISLSVPNFNGELAENSLAHLAMLDPRNLTRALDFGRTVKTPNHGRTLRKLVEQYLRVREADRGWWTKTAIQHRKSLKRLYALYHIKPDYTANKVLFAGAKYGVWKDIAELKNMSPQDAARVIIQRQLPFLVAVGALGPKAKDPDLVLALIEQMSPTELVSNTKMLERLGMKNSTVLRAAYAAALEKVAASKKVTFKTTRAVEAVQDEGLKEKLRGAQEKQIAALGGVDGNWLILVDRSPSMRLAVEVGRHLGATLAKVVNGKVHIVFFDGDFYKYVDATGKDYDKLLALTRNVDAGGSGTSIGAGLKYATEKGFEIDGIAIVSDGGENQAPRFTDAYTKFSKLMSKDVPVYLYLLKGESSDTFSKQAQAEGLDMQTFDLRKGFDYYSLPNIVATMKTQRYGLIDAIMGTPLLKLADVFK